MKRIIYVLLAIVCSLQIACKRDVLDVKSFGKVTIDSISPGQGPSGSYVVVYGRNFPYLKDEVKASIGGTDARVMEVTPTRLVIYLPTGATTGQLHFLFDRKNTTNGQYDYSGQVDPAATGPAFTVNESLTPAPIPGNMTPLTGKPGSIVTIRGYNFSATGNCTILFGNVAGTITSIKDTIVEVKVPVADPGEVTVTIKQGDFSITAGTFTVEEVPKGVKDVYWTELHGPTGIIYKGTFDDQGNPAKQKLYEMTGDLAYLDRGLKADPVHGWLYWANGVSIWKGSTDGSTTPEIIYTDVANVFDLDIDPITGKLYFTVWASSVAGQHAIKAINADGSGTAAELYLLPGEPMPVAMKLNTDAGKLYWTDLGTASIYEGSTGGSAVQPAKLLYNAADGLSFPINIAISKSTAKIFIVEGSNSIYTGAADGSGTLTKLPIDPTLIFNPMDIEIDDANQFIYWLNCSYVESLMRSKTDGTGAQQLIPGIELAYFFDVVF